ncbi:MAG: hypothetical protein WD076_02415, partial [Parvularculaceae bacterium]
MRARTIASLAGVAALFVVATQPARAEISINGAALDEETRTALALAYGEVPDGDYWYDAMSG